VKAAPRIVLIVAVAENGVIGRDNGMPWRLPGDLKHFKKTTLGKPVIMGRRTFESIGKPLPGRQNIVLTRDANFRAEGVQAARNIDEALSLAEREATKLGADEIAVIGGGEVYAQALPRAARVYLTEVHAAPDGAAHFPKLDRGDWREISRDGPFRSADDTYSHSFVVLERR
jgi:dihydrofolate reductase